jgi:hypothetical protein
LALDDVDRDALARELNRVSVAKLMGRPHPQAVSVVPGFAHHQDDLLRALTARVFSPVGS